MPPLHKVPTYTEQERVVSVRFTDLQVASTFDSGQPSRPPRPDRREPAGRPAEREAAVPPIQHKEAQARETGGGE